jgi:hypothetical protein
MDGCRAGPAGEETLAVLTLPIVGMRPHEMSQDLTTAGALAVAAFAALYVSNPDDPGGAVFGAAFACGASTIGLAAVGRVRPLTRRPLQEQGRLMGLSLIIGSALGSGTSRVPGCSTLPMDGRLRAAAGPRRSLPKDGREPGARPLPAARPSTRVRGTPTRVSNRARRSRICSRRPSRQPSAAVGEPADNRVPGRSGFSSETREPLMCQFVTPVRSR